MNINDKNLSKEELEYFIEKLSVPIEHTLDSVTNLPVLPTSDQAKLQSDLKVRLQRGLQEMQARNEDVPDALVELIKRL
jgi:hypothetical protein